MPFQVLCWNQPGSCTPAVSFHSLFLILGGVSSVTGSLVRHCVNSHSTSTCKNTPFEMSILRTAGLFVGSYHWLPENHTSRYALFLLLLQVAQAPLGLTTIINLQRFFFGRSPALSLCGDHVSCYYLALKSSGGWLLVATSVMATIVPCNIPLCFQIAMFTMQSFFPTLPSKEASWLCGG